MIHGLYFREQDQPVCLFIWLLLLYDTSHYVVYILFISTKPVTLPVGWVLLPPYIMSVSKSRLSLVRGTFRDSCRPYRPHVNTLFPPSTIRLVPRIFSTIGLSNVSSFHRPGQNVKSVGSGSIYLPDLVQTTLFLRSSGMLPLWEREKINYPSTVARK